MDTYLAALIDTLDTQNVPSEVDLILDGGAFNGAYTAGTLLYIQELEHRGHTTVKRLSGCSMGALFALGYMIDCLDSLTLVGRKIARDFKLHQCLESFISHVREWIADNKCRINVDALNGRLFVSYHDSSTKRKVTESHFRDHDHLCDVLIRSSFLPFIVDGSPRYKGRYFDGFTPPLFHDKLRPSIFISTMVPGYFTSSIIIKEGNSLDLRRVKGLEQTDNFFRSQRPSRLCSYVHDWSLWRALLFRLRAFVAVIFYLVEGLTELTHTYIPKSVRNHYIVDCTFTMLHDLMRDVISAVCY